MTRAHRRWHRRAMLALAIALPAGIAAALAARPAPLRAEPPAALALPARATVGGPWGTLASEGDLRARVRATAPAGHDHQVAIEVESATGWPELLAYATERAPLGGDLPAGAILLGAIATPGPTSLRLPPRAHALRTLLLYDLAHARVVASGSLPAAAGGDVTP